MESVKFLYQIANNNPKLLAKDVLGALNNRLKTTIIWGGAEQPKSYNADYNIEFIAVDSVAGDVGFVWCLYDQSLSSSEIDDLKMLISQIEGTSELLTLD